MDKSQFTRRYEYGGGVITARPNACFFCKHLSDIVWDYTNGPYILFCDKFRNANSDEIIAGLKGKCEAFEEEAMQDG